MISDGGGDSCLSLGLTPATRGVNATGDAGDASPAIFGQPGTEYLIPPKFVIVILIIVNSVLTVHIIWRNG